MTINQRPRIHYWLLVCSCYLLPLYSQSTPLPEAQNGRDVRQQANKVNCAHDSIAELIKTSPVILKALGARIFTDADLVTETELWWSGHNSFLSSATKPSSATQAGIDDDLMSVAANGILITLTPKTIYKGASLLKMAPTAKSALRISESAYQYEGQLNATLAPLSCFDGNVLKMLPTELIAFGKLVTVQQQREHQQQDHTQQEPQQHHQQQRSEQQHGADILRISINGLHRWTPQFENHIWKHLGWDDWSDFTLCSVTCGKGVQQRFRRCLLDNPMMNLNLNMNMNSNVVDYEVNGELSDSDDDADDNVAAEDEIVLADKRLWSKDKSSVASNNYVNDESNEKQSTSSAASSAESGLDTAKLQLRSREVLSTATTVVANTILHQRRHLRKQWSSYSKDTQDMKTKANSIADNDIFAKDGAVMRIFEGTFNDEELSEAAATTESAGGGVKERVVVIANKHKQRRKKKSAKSFSTLFCEGYNIEQRNCNTFECNDNINDLLKFYKKFPLPEELSTTSISLTQPLTNELNTLSSMAATTTEASSSSSAATTAAGAAGATVIMVPSSTLSNMGYVRSWHNNTNFTIMITLRVKNDTKTTARIFSIRNSTHNLYLEPSTEGLRLYLERDKTTEMLPVKFNLYDNRWHQVAISIQNGDFISIFVDCSWSNSFVVSKRLFSLPMDADVEIGRGFNGELQQLLVLPDNQERLQCSNVRTSINEVKRYIIDTFIDDYSN